MHWALVMALAPCSAMMADQRSADHRECFAVPRGFAVFARPLRPGAAEGVGQAGGRVEEDAVVGRRALTAELAATGGMIDVAAYGLDPAAYVDDRGDPTGVVAASYASSPRWWTNSERRPRIPSAVCAMPDCSLCSIRSTHSHRQE